MCTRVAVLILCTSAILLAQKDTGAIVGTVLDATDASVPGAQVTAQDTATDFIYYAATDATRQFVMSPVRVATYRISVIAKGFKTEAAGAITLEIQQRARMNFTLQPRALRGRCNSA
jgi:hypothetical protein